MNTYLLIFLLLLCFAFLEISNVSNKTLKVLHTVIAFVFIFVAGLRFETGVDWLAYQEYFDEIMPLHEALDIPIVLIGYTALSVLNTTTL